MTGRIAVISNVRNGGVFLDKWVAYYGQVFGATNLYLFIDGFDQPQPDAPGVNITVIEHEDLSRTAGDKRRAARLSDQAARLFARGYETVIATDIDEYLIADPATGLGLAACLEALPPRPSWSATGLDVVQHLDQEAALDPANPWLAQRAYAKVSARYTKACVMNQPLRWGSGMHRIKGRNFRIAPDLYLIHTGMIDAEIAGVTKEDAHRQKSDWSAHQGRREALFQALRSSEPREADPYLTRARRYMTWFRPLYALNKPGNPKGRTFVRLPQRFRRLL